MSPEQATKYRRGAARVNYMAQDRADLSNAGKYLAQRMATPKVGDEVALEPVMRYFVGRSQCRSK